MASRLAPAAAALVVALLCCAASASPSLLSPSPALSLLEVGAAGCTQTTAAEAQAAADAAAAGCCAGFQCPYAGGVCCGGASYCCPNGTVCLASGGAVAPQCGTAARDVVDAPPQQNTLGAPGGVPATPNADDPRDERLSDKKADEFTAGDDVGGAVEWRVVKAAGEDSSEEPPLEQLGPRVHHTNYTVDVQVHVANFMYTYYVAHSREVDLALREDVARNENMAVQSIEIANVSPLRVRTEGSEKMEKAYLRAMALLEKRRKGKKKSKKGGKSLVEVDSTWSPVSGVRVDARVYCGSEDHARALARHAFLTFDKQNPHPFAFKALQKMPAEAHGNAALPFTALESSKVLLNDTEVNDRKGIRVATAAVAEAASLRAEVAAADALTRKLDRDIERERVRLVRVDKRDARLAELRRRRRAAVAAKLAAQKRQEEARKAAHKADVLRRHEAVTKRDATEAGKKDKARKAREEENKKHEKKEVVKAKEWDVTTRPVSYAEQVRSCGPPDAHRVPQWSFAGDLCVVSGQVCTAADHLRRPLVAMPRECRPDGRLIFNRHDASRRTYRVDGWTSGRLAWNGGLTKATTQSLDGIAFPRAGSNHSSALELGDGWVPYGGPFAAPSVFRQGPLCVVTGLAKLKGGSARHFTSARHVIARLPEGCRPEGRLVFNLNHHKFTMRVDVLPNGDVEYVDGRKRYKWVSLSGVTFFANTTAAAGGSRLELLNGYKPFGLGYREPTATRYKNLCALSGVATGSSTQVIGKMPKGCAPATGRLSFWTNQGRRSFQIDVLPDGTVERVPPVFDSWTSLDGIFYAAGTPGEWEGKERQLAAARDKKEAAEKKKK